MHVHCAASAERVPRSGGSLEFKFEVSLVVTHLNLRARDAVQAEIRRHGSLLPGVRVWLPWVSL